MKKLFALILIMAILLSMTIFCTAAELLSVSKCIQVAGVSVTEENASDILGDGSVAYDVATGTLTLTDANITAEGLPFGLYADSDLTIDLVGENSLTVNGVAQNSTELAGIFVSGDLHFTGDGSLKVQVGGNPTDTVYGIYIGGYTDIICSTLRVFVEETTAATAYGIKVDNGGMLLADGGDHYFGVGGATEYTCGMDVNGNIVCYANVYVSDESSDLDNSCGVHAEEINIIDCWFESTFQTAFIADTGIYHSDEIYLWGQAEEFIPGTPITLTMHEYSPYYVTFGWHEYDVSVGGVRVTSLNKHDVLGNGTVSYDNKTNTLTLNNAHIKGGINAYYGVDLVLIGKNSITLTLPDRDFGVDVYAISSLSGRGSIYGPGSLDIRLSANDTQELYGIYMGGDSVICNCQINVTIEGSSATDVKGICFAGGPLTVENAEINVDLTGCDGNKTGIWSYAGLSINHSNVRILGADSAVAVSCGVLSISDELTVSGTADHFVNNTLDTLTAADPNAPVVIAPYSVPTLKSTGFSLSFEDCVQVNLYYTAENTEDFVEQGMLVFYADPGEAEYIKADEVYASEYEASSNRYMANTSGIAAKKMGDTRFYCAYAKLTDGSFIYSDLYQYSPMQYAMNMLGKDTTSQKQKALCVAMLNYGAAAQEYFGYRTESLMNAALTEEQKAMVANYNESYFMGAIAADSNKVGAFAATSGFGKKSASVSFEGAFSINYYFAPTAAVTGDMKLYIWNAKDYTDANILTADNATAVVTMSPGANGVYWGPLTGIAAKEIDNTYYVAAVYNDANGSTCCTGVIAYSLSRYCMNNANGSMGLLAKATAMYGHYAKAYFAN